MQQLQKSILSKIQPGHTPIFIISPTINDGDHLAVLLSDYVIPNSGDQEKNNKNKAHKNYFFTEDAKAFLVADIDVKSIWELKNNANTDTKNTTDTKGSIDAKSNTDKKDKKTISNVELKKLVAEARIKKIEDNKASLKFILEKDFDNGEVWGLQLDYKLFFELEVEKLYPSAFFIFLYGTKIKKHSPEISAEQLLHNVHDFYKANSSNSILLHVNNTIYLQELLLYNLPFSSGVEIQSFIKKKDNQLNKKSTDLYFFNDDDNDVQLKKELDSENIITGNKAWFSGTEILYVAVLDEHSNHENILKKINLFNNSFLASPFFHVICKNENEKRLIQKSLVGTKSSVKSINVVPCHHNVATTLNEIIKNSSCKYVVVDNVNLSCSPVDILWPYKNISTPSFTFSNLEAHKINEDKSAEVKLVDILAISSVPDNITFAKDTWAGVDGFDSDLGHKAAIWDFAIRLLIRSGNYALESEAVIINPRQEEDTLLGKYEGIERSMIPYEVYSSILNKHKSLFQDNFNRIIKLFSENQHIPQHEIVKLHYNISTLNSLLSHSNHELHALNVSRSQLQHHINVIEGRWYFKLARKLSHYKNIFFKENASNKKGILKIFRFLIFAFTKPGFRIARKIIKGAIRKLYLLIEDRPVKIVYLDNSGNENVLNYNDWIKHKLDKAILKKEYNSTIDDLKIQPKISILFPVYNTPIDFLEEAINSVLDQLYENWQLCIADDCSTNPQIKRILNAYAMKDKRISLVFRDKNGHISESSNSALALATGDYVTLFDHDDLLTPNALFEIVRYINKHPDIEFIYSDEDKIDAHRNFMDPFFKPDWSPDRFMAINYVSHLVTIKKELIDSVGGFRKGLEGSQDYDLFLRLFELTDKIGHIPKVLYHWRIHSASVASEETNAKPYAYIAAKKALEEALVRRNTPGEVHYLPLRGSYRIKYNIESYDKVSIIIPTKDQVQLMKNTVDSIFSLTSYPNYEVIVLNNNSTSKEFFELMADYEIQHGDRFKCIECSFPFNFSKLINVGVEESDGKYILMLNNDVEIIQNDWVSNMVSFCQHKRIGAVGVKLLYPNDHIQHAGTVIGLGAVAGHILVGVYKNSPGYFNCLQTATNYSAVTAACLMVRRDVYEEVGGMEEFLEVEYNDVDFCLKIVEHGYYNLYLPDVTLYHYESTTRGHPGANKASYERHLREVAYFKEKWEKYVINDPFYNPNLTTSTQDFRVELSK